LYNLDQIKLDKKIKLPLYQQLFDKLRELIINEIIPSECKLPSIRDFSKILGVNTSTIVNAYQLLEDSGLARKKPGSGTYVDISKEKYTYKTDVKLTLDESDYDVEEGSEVNINFASASPNPALFPIKEFQEAMNLVLERDGGNAFTYQEAQGYLPLRKAIVDNIKRVGINTIPDDIYVISGAQQGIDIVTKALISAGDYVFAENPTYSGALAAFESRNAKVITFNLEKDGPDMKDLEKLMNMYKPRFIYTMPNFQNPTGCTWSERKKKYFLWLCKKHDALVVEDDYLSELNFTKETPLPLKSFDEDGRVIYIKSFSKIFMPGLRVAYLITPSKLKEKIMNAKYVSDISTSGLMQRVLEIYMKKDLWENHLKRMRREYSLRYIAALNSARKYLLNVKFTAPGGGLNLWIKLPDWIDSNTFSNECIKKGVSIVPGKTFMPVGGEHYFRLSYAGVNEEQIENGMIILGGILSNYKK